MAKPKRYTPPGQKQKAIIVNGRIHCLRLMDQNYPQVDRGNWTLAVKFWKWKEGRD